MNTNHQQPVHEYALVEKGTTIRKTELTESEADILNRAYALNRSDKRFQKVRKP